MNKIEKKLTIKQCQHEILGGWFEFKLEEFGTGVILVKDSIDDTGQGIDTAKEQIYSILRRKGYIQ